MAALLDSLWRQSYLPPVTLELCRRRLAQLHRTSPDWEPARVELEPEQEQALPDWHQGGVIGPAEAACLAFTEVYAMDAQAITDEHAAAVKAHFGDAGLVLLIEALGIFDGMTRLSLLWQWHDGERH
jgi:hypothetical protein